MIACAKNSILGLNKAAIEMILPVNTAKGGVKDCKFASESFSMKGQQTRIATTTTAQCHDGTIY